MINAELTVCLECDGTGRVIVERLVGGCNAHGPWQDYKEVLSECDGCNGTGRVDHDDDQ